MYKNVMKMRYNVGELQYLNLVNDIIKTGYVEKGRNGNTKCLIGATMRFTLEDNDFPLLTTKKMAWRTCLKELLWFIRGETDNRKLQKENVKIWNGNATREFLDSRGLHHLEENDLGPVYGHQWRHFNADYVNSDTDYTGKGVDQLQNVIDTLQNEETRNSRRIIMSAWNPCQIDEMALPPCHVLTQFNVVNGDELYCSLYQRSGDVGLGIPFNMASYAALTHLLAKHCGLKAKGFIHHIGNAHIYEEHIPDLKFQLLNYPFSFPRLYINEKRDNINDYILNDFKLEDYDSYGNINMEMII